MATYKSQYTGAQIDEAVGKANNLVANNGEETTADLSTLKVGDVNYKIPEGAEQEPPAMEIFRAMGNLSFHSKSIEGNASVIINGNASTPSFEIPFPLVESETTEPSVVNNGYTINLKQSVKDKLAKAVVLPGSPIDATRIVSIAADGTQQNLALGDGITVENGVISASGGGGGSVSLYDHTLTMAFECVFSDVSAALSIRTHILTNSADRIESLTLEQCMEYFGGTEGAPANGKYLDENYYDYPLEGIRFLTSNTINIAYYEPIDLGEGSFAFLAKAKQGTISNIIIMGDYVRQII